MKIVKRKDPFRIEERRAKLARGQSYKRLRETYSTRYPEIKNINTPIFWDSFNTEGIKGKNPMDGDRINIISRYIKGGKVLNIGFGSASLERKYFKSYQQESLNWSAIDISPASVKKAKKEFPQCKFEVRNILNLKFKDNSFDYVVTLEVLEHISPRNTFKALNEIFRVIKQGGGIYRFCAIKRRAKRNDFSRRKSKCPC